ncbi:MAG: glycosyltransferase family A protein, partial [Ruminococcus sp.]
MQNYLLSVIAIADCDDGFGLTVDSIVKATDNLKDTQLIIADTVCSDTTQAVTEKAVSEYSDNVIEVKAKDMGIAQGLNSALKEVKGKYVLFAEEGTVFKKKAIRAFLRSAEEYPNAIPVMAAVTMNKDDTLKKYARFPIERDGVIDLSLLPYLGHTALSTYLFNTEFIKGLSFDENIHNECKKKFVLQALLNNPYVFVIEKLTVFYTHALENDNNRNLEQHYKWYYSDSLRNFIIPFMKELCETKGEVPKFVQYALTQIICAKYGNNYYEQDKGVLSKDEAMEFYDLTLDALAYIDNAIFTEAAIRCKYILRSLWMQLLKGKHQKANIPYKVNFTDELITFDAQGAESARISTPTSVGMTINVINYNDGKLEIDAEFTGKDFLEADEIELYAEYSGKKVRLEEYPTYGLLKCFGIPYAKKYSVHFFVPVDEKLKTIKFSYMLCGEYQQLPIHFASQFSRLRLRFGKAYWKFSDKLALGVKNNNELYTFPCTGFRHFTREIGLYVSMLLHSSNPISACKYIGFRTIYHLSKPFFKNKRIILTFDKLYKAGDNGEYFWKYANSVADGVETYYIVSDTAPDYPRLLAYDKKHTVVHNSFKCRLLALHAEA